MRMFASEVMPALQAFEPDPSMPAGSELALRASLPTNGSTTLSASSV
jgi:hypothetical protein